MGKENLWVEEEYSGDLQKLLTSHTNNLSSSNLDRNRCI